MFSKGTQVKVNKHPIITSELLNHAEHSCSAVLENAMFAWCSSHSDLSEPQENSTKWISDQVNQQKQGKKKKHHMS